MLRDITRQNAASIFALLTYVSVRVRCRWVYPTAFSSHSPMEKQPTPITTYGKIIDSNFSPALAITKRKKTLGAISHTRQKTSYIEENVGLFDG